MKNLMTTAQLITLAAATFKDHKTAASVYAAEDGNIFLDENRAKLHAKSADIKYHTITRTQALGGTPAPDPEDVPNIPTELNAEVVAERVKQLEELELDVKNYQEMKAMVNFFQIKTSDMKAQTLIDALNDYKTKISG